MYFFKIYWLADSKHEKETGLSTGNSRVIRMHSRVQERGTVSMKHRFYRYNFQIYDTNSDSGRCINTNKAVYVVRETMKCLSNVSKLKPR